MTTFSISQFKVFTNEDIQALKNTVEKLNTQKRTIFNGKKGSKGLTRDCRCNLSPMISIGNEMVYS